MEQNELTEGHRRDYLNVEMRLLHNDCCASLQFKDETFTTI